MLQRAGGGSRSGAEYRRGKAEGRETKGIVQKDWAGQACFIVASGPSLTQEDVEKARGQARVVVVNECYRLAPWADALYACDGVWWDFNYYKVHAAGFSGELWTQDEQAARTHEINYIRGEYTEGGIGARCDGLSFDPTMIRLGGNSGHQATNWAVLRGCNPIIWLGFDMQHTGNRVHWHGDHPRGLNNASEPAIEGWRVAAANLYRDATAAGITIINATRETSLVGDEYPRRMSIDEAIVQIHSTDHGRGQDLRSGDACAV